MPPISRRVVLALLFAAGGLAGGGTLWSNRPEALVGKILAKRFPGVKISPDSISALTRDLELARYQALGRRVALEAGALAAGIVGVDVLSRWRLTATQFSHLERTIVTFFILGSDLLDVKDPKTDIVTYNALPVVCPNRFARYET
jgi:hypothetical protein